MNVAKDAQMTGLFIGSTAATMNAPATREECALYAFNALSAVDMVNYSALLDTYTSTGLVGTELGTTLGEKQYGLGCATTSELSIPNSRGQYVIGKVKMTGDLADSIGRSVKVWYTTDNKGNATAISEAYTTDIVLGENHYGYSYAEMTDSKKAGFIAKAEKASDMIVYINGACYDENGNIYTVADVGGKKGVLVSFVDTAVNGIFDGIADKVFVLEKKAAQLTADPTKRTVAGTDTILIPGVTDGYEDVDGIVGYEDLSYGDVILYWTDGQGTLRIEKADSFTGELTGTKSLTTGMGYVIDEQVYRLSDLAGTADLTYSMYDIAMAPSASYRQFTYFVDNGGYIIAAVPVNGELSDYVVIAEIMTVEPQGVDSIPYVEALLVNMEGEKTVARLSSVIVNSADLDHNGISDHSVRYTGRGAAFDDLIDTTGGRGSYTVNSSITALVGNTFFTYTEANGTYTLASVYSKTVNRIETEVGSLTRTAGSLNDIQNGKASFAAGLTGNADTKFVVYNKTTNQYNVYEGISKVPNIELISTAETGYIAVNDFVKYVFVGKNAIEATSVISEDTAFILSTTPIRDYYNTTTASGYGVYAAVVNGELAQVMIKMSANDVRAMGTGYKTVYYDGGYIVNMVDNAKGLAAQNGYDISHNTIRLTDNSAYSYSFAEDAPAFIVDTNRSNDVTETTISALVSDDNDAVCVVIPKAGSSVASYIVVFENAPTAAVTITTQPVSAAYNTGDEPASLYVSAAAADSQSKYLSYQWYAGTDADFRHAEKVIGATSSVLSKDHISTSAAGVTYYFVKVTHARSGMQTTSVVSDPAVITVHSQVSAPVIREQSQSASVAFGATELPRLTVSVETPAEGTLSYQWYMGESAIEGADSATLQLTNDLIDTTKLGANEFHVVVTHQIEGNPNAGVTTGDVITVTVVPVDSDVTISGDSMVIENVNDIVYSATLSEAITGTVNYVLEWKGASGWTELSRGSQVLNEQDALLYAFSTVYDTAGLYRVTIQIDIDGYNTIVDTFSASLGTSVSEPTV